MQKSQEHQLSKDPRKYKEYQVGNKVWLEGTNLKRIEGIPKLAPRRYGPFRVAAKISHIAYRLDLPETWKIHNVFHASLLTLYKETPKHGENFTEPLHDIIDDTPEWEVETILGQQTFGRWKKKQYLVRWKGYSQAHDQWVNADDMHVEDLVRAFEGKDTNRDPHIKAAGFDDLNSNQPLSSSTIAPVHRFHSERSPTVTA
jgi:hypothetical protein